jgi:hypothetical protein
VAAGASVLAPPSSSLPQAAATRARAVMGMATRQRHDGFISFSPLLLDR